MDITGEGRWLIVRNTSIEPICVPHPSRDAAEDESLSLASHEARQIGDFAHGEPEWLTSPILVRLVTTGRLELYRSDELPSSEFTVSAVSSMLTAKGWSSSAALTAYQACAIEPIPENVAYMLWMDVTPEARERYGPTYLGQRWDLYKQHLPWLREIRDLERRWQKREGLLARLDARIAELEDRARGL